jgi:hypothetical protein
MLDNREAVEKSAREIIIRNKRCKSLGLNDAGIGQKQEMLACCCVKDICRPQALTSHMHGKIWY